jgi:AGCS family alanine or glycine:cation symporter
MLVRTTTDANTASDLRRLTGTVTGNAEDGWTVQWATLASSQPPRLPERPDGTPQTDVFGDYVGAALTGHAFDRVLPGLGMWLVTVACWLFALSTIISWSYYGEQGIIYLVGPRGVTLYKLGYCTLILVATLGFIRTDVQLDEWTSLGTGVMLIANIPIMLIFGSQAMRAYRDYLRRLDAGEMIPPHGVPPLTDVIEGRDPK